MRAPSDSPLPASIAWLQNLAQNSWVGLALGVTALIVVAIRWQQVDITVLVDSDPLTLIISGLSYALALIAFAFLSHPLDETSRVAIGAGLSAHALKYVPGTIWQGQRLLAVGGPSAVAKFAAGVVLAGGFALVTSGVLIWAASGTAVVLVVVVFVGRQWGPRELRRLMSIAILGFVAILGSGFLLGLSLGFDAWGAARDVAGAWGLGVLVVPVPAGLGVREIYFAASAASETGAALAVAHRTVTLIADACVGSLGFVLLRRATERSFQQ